MSYPCVAISLIFQTLISYYFDSLSPQYEECFCSLCQKSSEFVHQDIFNFVCLFDLDADPNAVHARLNKNLLIFVSGDSQRVEKNLGRTSGFNLGDVVSF